MKTSMIYIITILFLFFYLVFGHNGWLKYNEMLRIQEDYRKLINEMDEKIAYLERELELMKNDKTYMDYVIRRELGLQKFDEDQYIIPDNATVPGK